MTLFLNTYATKGHLMKKLCLVLITAVSCNLLYGVGNEPVNQACAESGEKVFHPAQPSNSTHKQLSLVFEERVHEAVQPKNNSIATKPAQANPTPYSFNKKWIAIRRAQIESIKVEALSRPFPMAAYPPFYYSQPVVPTSFYPYQQTASQPFNQGALPMQPGIVPQAGPSLIPLYQPEFQSGIVPQAGSLITPHYQQPTVQLEQVGQTDVRNTTQSPQIAHETLVQEQDTQMPSAEKVCFLLANIRGSSHAKAKPIRPS